MKAFVSYSHRDEALRERFDTHLTMLRREGSISAWYDRRMVAGGRIDDEVKRQLQSSQIFLALVSPDFLSSGYCYDKEMTRAIERDTAGEMAIVPIILEPCDWLASPLGKFKAIPRDGKAISEWTNKNTAVRRRRDGRGRCADPFCGGEAAVVFLVRTPPLVTRKIPAYSPGRFRS
jgi:hypothetical protein